VILDVTFDQCLAALTEYYYNKVLQQNVIDKQQQTSAINITVSICFADRNTEKEY